MAGKAIDSDSDAIEDCSGKQGVNALRSRALGLELRRQPKNRVFDNSLVLAAGDNGEWTPHDLRRTSATTMQRLGVPNDLIDRCQNHVLGGPAVRRHYLLYDFADEKRAAWEKLGARVDQLLNLAAG